MILALILACEVLFWVFLLSGLAARYVLRRPRLGAVLLLLAPTVDAVLLVAVAIDLRGGASATWTHGLAALYIGFSVAFGHALIRWADIRFAHRFAGGPAPVKLFGAAHTKASWRGTLRLWLGAAITTAILGALIAWTGDPTRTEALAATLKTVGIVVVIDLLISISDTLWPRRPPLPATAP